MRSFWIILKNKKNLNDLTKNLLEVCAFYKLAQEKMHRPSIITTQGQCKKIQDTYMVCEYYIIKDYSTLGVHYRDLQARVHEQETRNLTLHEAQPSAVLNFEFLVRERVLVNPIMHEQRVLKTF